MNTKAVLAICMTASAGIAGTTGYILGRMVSKDQYHKQLEEEVTQVRAEYLRELGKAKVELLNSIEVEAEVDISDEELENPEVGIADIVEAASQLREVIDGEGYSTVNLEQGEEQVAEFISLADYLEDDDYDKNTFQYFLEDGILVDEELDEVPIETSIGVANASMLRTHSETNAYLRNEKEASDFEIEIVEGSYSALVKPHVNNVFDDPEGFEDDEDDES